MTNYAFFDVVQTIYPGYSMADFYHSPSVSRLLTTDFYQEDMAIGKLYKSGQITYAQAGRRAAKLCARSIKGMNQKTVESLALDFITQKGVKPFVLPLFSLLQQSGYIIVLVSGSVDFIVQAIAKHTHADFYHGTTPELGSNSVYTGNITHQLDDHEKQKLITQIYDLSHSKTIAFGDSTGDIPMLSLADQAFIINPHQDELLELIKSNPSYHLVDENNIIQVVQKYLE